MTAAAAGDSSQLLSKKSMEEEEDVTAVSAGNNDKMDGKSAGHATVASKLPDEAEELLRVLVEESSKMDDRPWAAQSRELSYNLNSDEAFDVKTQESTASEIDTEKPGFNGKSIFFDITMFSGKKMHIGILTVADRNNSALLVL